MHKLSVLLVTAALLVGCGEQDHKAAPPPVDTSELQAKAEQQAIRAAELQQRLEEDLYMFRRFATVSKVTGLSFDASRTLVLEADAYNFPVYFVIGVIAKETGETFNPNLVHYNTNGTYDTGLMQINSATAGWLKEAAGMPNADLTNPSDSIKLGVWYLNYLRQQCDEGLTCTLSRYNGDTRGVYAPAVHSLASRYGDRLHSTWEEVTR